MEFVLQPAQSIELQQVSWSFQLWVIATKCRSAIEAKEKWSGALEVVREFLLADELFALIASN